MRSDLVFVLGAQDPEMQVVSKLAGKFGQVCMATKSGQPVRHAEAYLADGTSPDAGDGAEVVFVECAVVGLRGVAIDHHRAGDPGYGLPPEAYWPASSLGQLVTFLLSRFGANEIMLRRLNGSGPVLELVESLPGEFDAADRLPGPGDWRLVGGVPVAKTWIGETVHVAPAEWVRLVAAADHCLAHAYAGRCPGVDPDRLLDWRLTSRAEFQKISVEELKARVEAARQALKAAPRIFDGRVADFREGTVPELPEAAAREGIPFVAVLDERGQKKVVLQAASPDIVRAFMSGEIVPGLSRVYGDPERGFAGGFIS
jgi:hypothetical protein